MSTTASRTQSNGILLVNGELDEYTSQGNVSFENRVTASDVTVTGILDEITYNISQPTIVNQTTYSQEFQNAAWTKSGSISVVDNSAVAPDRTQTAAEAEAVGSGQYPNIARNYTVTAGQVVTYSIYAKYVNQTYVNLVQEGYGSGYNVNINIQNGTNLGVGANITFVSTACEAGWFRISITYTIPVGQTTARPQFRIGLYDGSSYTGSKVLLWGAQFEFASTPTIYQPIAAANTLVNTGITQKITNTGDLYVSGGFDETSGTIVQDGLLLYMNAWPKTYSGGTRWLDLGPQQNNATLNGNPTYSATEGGGSLAFTGAQDGAVSSALLNVAYTGKTVFAVARMNSAGWTPGVTQYRALFGTNGAVGTRNFNFYVLHNANNTYQFHFSALGTANVSGNVTGMIDDTWFIAAVTVTSNTITYYFNGTQVSSTGGFTLNQYQTTTSEFIGRADNYWYGDIAAIALYTRALSADEIAANYQAFAGRVGL